MSNGGSGGGSGSGGGRNTNTSFECDVGLSLNTESPDCSKRMPHHPDHEINYLRSHLNASLAASGDGRMSEAGGKGLFTANQWQELIRQTNICKYMMAQIPVPLQLLHSASLVPLPKSNRGATATATHLDITRLSSGSSSDAEPWRCRRTDGKKWRCSRDVTPDHKYCERHTHKNRPNRSRKPVDHELVPSALALHTSSAIPSAINTLHKPLSQSPLPHMVSATTTNYGYDYDQSRCSEWFMKSGIASTNQQFQELIPGLGIGIIASKRDKNHSVFQQNYEGEEGPATRQHLTGSKCSLTLSMQSGGSGNIGIEEDNQNYPIHSDIGHTAQWVNSSTAAWMGSGSAPGGPLGEALCLGIPTNSASTSTSCEDGLHALNFIRERGSPTCAPKAICKGEIHWWSCRGDEVLEDGNLGKLLQGLPRLKAGHVCEGCGGARFLPCLTCNGSCKLVMAVKEDVGQEQCRKTLVMPCSDCNENGLMLCPICS